MQACIQIPDPFAPKLSQYYDYHFYASSVSKTSIHNSKEKQENEERLNYKTNSELQPISSTLNYCMQFLTIF